MEHETLHGEPEPHEHGAPWDHRGAGKRWMAMAAHHHHGGRGRRGRGGWGPGFDDRFGPMGGPFFGRGPKVGRGEVRDAIQVLLAEQPMHGYQIIQELTERSGGVWRPSPGSVYPTLQQLEDEDLVRAEEADGKRVFHLTPAGEAAGADRGARPAPWEREDAGGPLMELFNTALTLRAAVMQVAQAGSDRQVTAAKEILSRARKELYKLLAEDEPMEG
jgi:DNA-binding PadR family transcriptional regulator